MGTIVGAEFLRAYRGTVQDAPFLPCLEDGFRKLLAVFLLDKALYELSYEMNNRPTWVRVPLMGILSLPLEAGGREWNWIPLAAGTRTNRTHWRRRPGDRHPRSGAKARRNEAQPRRGARRSSGIRRAPCEAGGRSSQRTPYQRSRPSRSAADNGHPVSSVTVLQPACPRPGETPQQSISDAYRRVFAVGGKLGVRACGVIASHPQSATHQWIFRLPAGARTWGSIWSHPATRGRRWRVSLTAACLRRCTGRFTANIFKIPWDPISDSRENFCNSFCGRIQRSANGTGGNDPGVRSPSARRSADFRFANRIWAFARQRPTDWGNLSSLLAEVLGARFWKWKGVRHFGRAFEVRGRCPGSARRKLRRRRPEPRPAWTCTA